MKRDPPPAPTPEGKLQQSKFPFGKITTTHAPAEGPYCGESPERLKGDRPDTAFLCQTRVNRMFDNVKHGVSSVFISEESLLEPPYLGALWKLRVMLTGQVLFCVLWIHLGIL